MGERGGGPEEADALPSDDWVGGAGEGHGCCEG